jgi:hypothetical protein
MGRATSNGPQEHHENPLRGVHRPLGEYLKPEVRRAVWRLGGALETPDQCTPSVSELHMAHAGPLPPIWDFLDNPFAETLHLLSLEEFTEHLSGCPGTELLRNPSCRC